MTTKKVCTVLAEADLLVTEAEVGAAISRMAQEITDQLKDANPILICVMNGGLIFTGQLLTKLVFPLEVDYVHATRYGHEISGAGLNWIVKPQLELKGRTVLLLDDILVCPHDQTDHCPCHKPKPGLFVEAAFKWHLDLDSSFVVSEKWQDAEAARTVGCTSLLLDSPWIGKAHHDFVLPDLETIVDKIQQLRTAKRVIA